MSKKRPPNRSIYNEDGIPKLLKHRQLSNNGDRYAKYNNKSINNREYNFNKFIGNEEYNYKGKSNHSRSSTRSDKVDRNIHNLDSYRSSKVRSKSQRSKHGSKGARKRRLNYKRIAIAILMVFALVFTVANGIKGILNKRTEEAKVQKQLEIERKSVGTNLKKYTVMIDPGHGGNDKGALSRNQKYYEKDIVLQISKKVEDKLSEHKDINVIMTRTGDEYVSLLDRVKMSNEEKPDAFVSIHLNAQMGEGATGIETWFKKSAVKTKEDKSTDSKLKDINKDKDGNGKQDLEQDTSTMEQNSYRVADNGADDDGDVNYSKLLAQSVQATLLTYVDAPDRGILKSTYEVLRENDAPAILVEAGFISTGADVEKLITDKYQETLAEGIAQGILAYLDNYKK